MRQASYFEAFLIQSIKIVDDLFHFDFHELCKERESFVCMYVSELIAVENARDWHKNSMFDTQRTDPSIKYSSNPHIRFRLCSIVKHTLFSRWFHMARSRIGFQLSLTLTLFFSLSLAWIFFSSLHIVHHVTHDDEKKTNRRKKNICYFRWLANIGVECVFIGFNVNFITLWSCYLTKHTSKYFVLFTRYTILNI